jgi:hypothetical protein
MIIKIVNIYKVTNSLIKMAKLEIKSIETVIHTSKNSYTNKALSKFL